MANFREFLEKTQYLMNTLYLILLPSILPLKLTIYNGSTIPVYKAREVKFMRKEFVLQNTLLENLAVVILTKSAQVL